MEYSEGLVTYLDILGFQEKIRSEKTPGKINRILELFHKLNRTQLSSQYYEKFHFATLSDCSFRMVHVGKGQLGMAFSLEHEMLADLQAKMIRHKDLIRGAITYGQYHAHVNGNSDGGIVAFGPAIVEAYSMEQNEAIFPRIVISPVCFEKCDVTFTPPDSKVDKPNNFKRFTCLVQDDSGVWFIDYLRWALEKEVSSKQPTLFAHKELIEEHFSDKESDDGKKKRIRGKYRWLMHYHNSTIEKVSDAEWEKYLPGRKKEELKIKLSEHPCH